ncbi:DUF1523 family protein [Campylobacter concisus]|uniref:DUF1523 family protein n=1 Tax=Campylobacter concisus TaxID=199 RepID=UPI0011E7D083|nr:DUF1523 family protein [Campylobacter concisus]
MIKFIKRICVSFVVLLHLFLALVVDYSFPHYASVQITGGDVKRMDKDGIIDAKNPADGPVRDVYFIYAKDAQNDQKVMAYRNEDTAWGFPFYFKFNSADIQAMAQGFANSDNNVTIKYYGYRISMLNEFRNVISIKDSGTSTSWPIASYVLYFILFISLVIWIRKINKAFAPKVENLDTKKESV